MSPINPNIRGLMDAVFLQCIVLSSHVSVQQGVLQARQTPLPMHIILNISKSRRILFWIYLWLTVPIQSSSSSLSGKVSIPFICQYFKLFLVQWLFIGSQFYEQTPFELVWPSCFESMGTLHTDHSRLSGFYDSLILSRDGIIVSLGLIEPYVEPCFGNIWRQLTFTNNLGYFQQAVMFRRYFSVAYSSVAY